MKIKHAALSVAVLAVFVFSAIVMAQDADKDKLIAIEQEYAAPAPPAGTPTPMQKYMYDGPVMALNPAGRLNITSKTQLMAGRGRGNAAPNPANANVKRQTTRSNFHVELYDDTALITYNQAVVETGHEDAAQNTTTNTMCLDTFIKRDGNWYGIANSCVYAPKP